jgi:hypothetical protein
MDAQSATETSIPDAAPYEAAETEVAMMVELSDEDLANPFEELFLTDLSEPRTAVAQQPAQAAVETAVSNDDPDSRDADVMEPETAAAQQASDSLERVELELALHNQNVVSLGFEESIRTALDRIGGEILFQMRVENEDCQRVAAVRLGQGNEAEFALVILPPGGGLMRVEPVAQSTNPVARITESYASLMDVFRAAA